MQDLSVAEWMKREQRDGDNDATFLMPTSHSARCCWLGATHPMRKAWSPDTSRTQLNTENNNNKINTLLHTHSHPNRFLPTYLLAIWSQVMFSHAPSLNARQDKLIAKSSSRLCISQNVKLLKAIKNNYFPQYWNIAPFKRKRNTNVFSIICCWQPSPPFPVAHTQEQYTDAYQWSI